MIAKLQARGLTPDEYLAWEREQPIRHEYIDGEVYAMTGGTLPHNAIAVNLISILRGRLRGTQCRVYAADAKVRISAQGPYFYPDVVVTCDERDRRATEAISYPKLIVEVLSPSTAGFDRGDKFKFYRRIPTLEEYVLIDSEKVGIDCYRKSSGSKWELTAYPEEGGDILELVSLNFQCPLALVYEEVEFPEPSSQMIEG